MDHKLYMHRALQLAKRGIRTVSPNPMVGCVIVHEGKIIGEGFTSPYGGPHAEVNAVNDVQDPSLLSESTAYVTLEPCAHYGKTPPCADMLIEKKIKKVVIACRDPFVEVDGKGIEKLKKGDVEVELGVLEHEAKEINKRFFTYHLKKRPYVILKWAQTADHFIARDNYDSKWISNTQSRQLVHKWRSEEDAILVGKNTALHDDPALTVRDWQGINPTRILVDSNLEISKDKKLLDSSANTIILNTIKEDEVGNIKWIKLEEMNITSILNTLFEERIQSVIIEGGTQVLNSFIQDNCWDEARVFTTKIEFGSGIAAPKVQGEIVETETILEDQLTIYKNTNG